MAGVVDITVPEVGESISEGVLVSWSKENGDFVQADDPLFELETDKITLTVEAEQAGRLAILVEAGSTVKIGQKVGTVDTEAPGESPPPKREEEKEEPPAKEVPAGLPQAKAKLDRAGDLSPAVRRLVEEHALDPASIPGTGKDGRITKEDVLLQLEKPRTEALKPPPVEEQRPRETRKPMSALRLRIAERLLQAQQNAAILTTFNEVDMTEVLAWRKKHQEAFQEKHGIKLGFMSFFIKAVVEALKEVPELNARIDGNEIVYHHYYHIGVAVGTDRGLVVPVVRDADLLGFAGIEKALADFAKRARERTLSLDDLSGGVFTVSNGGIYGNLLSTPILNPPQSGILGMHAVKNRPVAVGDEVGIRPMMYLALSYDHRLVDGKEAVTFLKRVVACVENPEKMLLEI